jgi:hypothetical protein
LNRTRCQGFYAPPGDRHISYLAPDASDPCIISEEDAGLPASAEWTARSLAVLALLVGTYAAWFYHQAGLTLSHYDAKAHLVVARRVVDSLTPGWEQIGAVWLPLPHLLNLLPVQVDALYRSGASGVAISVLSFGLVVYACARLVLQVTGSRIAASAGILIVALNPDVLYLQATPMTEPLLLALSTLGIALLARWVSSGRRWHGHAAGAVLAGACLTRYEAWPLTAAALVMALLGRWRGGRPAWSAAREVALLAVYPAAAGLLFLLQSRLTVGQWFVTGGFYVPDNIDTGRPFKTIGSIWWASHHLNGYGVLLFATVGGVLTVVAGVTRRAHPAALVAVALAATAALTWYAFFSGHPFRFRYMVPLVPALAVYAGCGAGLLPARLRRPAAAILVVLVLVSTRPFSAKAPMVVEAQLDREHSAARRAVTTYLESHRNGTGKVLASLGSLSHYVQELSRAGFVVRDFVHEGNGELWTAAVASPRAHVHWILVEELSEGGDVLARRTWGDPAFTEGFSRVAEGGGVALYARTPTETATRQ